VRLDLDEIEGELVRSIIVWKMRAVFAFIVICSTYVHWFLGVFCVVVVGVF